MKLAHKLLLSPLIIAGIAILGVAGLSWNSRDGLAQIQSVNSARFEAEHAIGRAREELVQIRAEVFRTLTLVASNSIDEAAVKAVIKGLSDRAESISRQIGKGRSELPADFAREHFEKAAALVAQLTKQAAKSIDLSTMDPNVGIGSMRAAEDTYKLLEAELDAITKAVDGQVAEREARVTTRHGQVTLVLSLCLLGCTLVAVLATHRSQRHLTAEVGRACHLAERVAGGDLSTQIDSTRSDEIGQMIRSLNEMSRRLRDSIQTVQEATQNVGLASSEVAAGNTDLSQRTEKAASNLQMTVSALEVLSHNLHKTVESASLANELSVSACTVAKRGGDVVTQVVRTMDKINSSSGRIADIIGTIDGIAFQTNILALNAAVEAARAGEQGRGFAVVAGEVRSLAQHSTEAAREIKKLIGTSVGDIEAGSRLVVDAGKTMEEIVAGVQRVSDIIGEISDAANRQSQGFNQINSSIADLDGMTQQNAALVEQGAAAAESLRQQAERMAEVVRRFHLE